MEALSGVPFPRGSGLVTRCATQLTMKRVPTALKWSAKAWLSDGDQPDATGPIESKADVAAVIERLTSHLVSRSGSFSNISIVIEVEAPDVPDLTLYAPPLHQAFLVYLATILNLF
jgi:interferon-induced GTP-binding protein Mx